MIRRRGALRRLLIACALLGLPTDAIASDEAVDPDAHTEAHADAHTDAHTEAHAEAHTDADADAHAYFAHHIGLIIGGASTAHDERRDSNGFVIGLDYEWRFSRWAGIGPIAELATGDLREAAFVGSLYLHPWRGIVVAVGPGVEVSREGTAYLTRVAFAYQFHFGRRFTIAPDFSIDLVDGTPIYVYGAAFGVGF